MREILTDMDDKSLHERNPMRDVQKQTALPKRFYKHVTVGEDNGAFLVLLDSKSVKTPAKKVFALPVESLAQAAVEEWSAQETLIDPAKMPITRMANSALDGVVDKTEEVMDEIIQFSGTDLLFYRADSPSGLVELQAKAWDPIVEWADSELGAKFIITEGIIHVMQPSEAIDAYTARLKQYASPFVLTGLHSATTLLGSALLALAVAEGRLSAEDAWQAAHVDEDWNITHWGTDDEAEARRAFRWADMKAANLLISSKNT
jgi:chaperone required for assembly of F1-ATPase